MSSSSREGRRHACFSTSQLNVIELSSFYSIQDTAFLYNNEALIGKVLKDYIASGKAKREDIFITTKLPFTAHDPKDVEDCVNLQLKALQVDYIDLYLMHCPMPLKVTFSMSLKNRGWLVLDQKNRLSLKGKADDSFAPALENGMQIPAIGLSNFNTTQLQNVYDHARIKPANLQVECHVYWPQTELYELCKKLNISFTAYAPLGSRGRN
ncbi:unnamed protein product, partial [Strongylus vulgaris]